MIAENCWGQGCDQKLSYNNGYLESSRPFFNPARDPERRQVLCPSHWITFYNLMDSYPAASPNEMIKVILSEDKR